MKIVALSFDDGTIYDLRFIELLNKYNIRATLNLNSKLDNFVWYFGDTPIERLKLNEVVEKYDGHEVCSHSLTHPYFSSLSKEEIIRQVKEDCENLSKIFNRDINAFAFPFHDQTEEHIQILKENGATEVFIFGSLANGKFNENSDIDIAVKGLKGQEFYKVASILMFELENQFDLIDLDDKENRFSQRKS